MRVKINERLTVEKGTIAGDFEILRAEMCVSYGYIAELLDVQTKHLEELKTLKEKDVKIELVFRLFFFAQSVIDDKTEDCEYVKRLANDLKRSCRKEQTKRIRVY